jgi:DNA polymerase III delta subunit
VPLSKLTSQLGGDPLPIYILIGDEQLLASRATELVTDRVMGGGLAAFNQSVYRASDPGAGEAISVARTLPMMSNYRLVVIRGIEEGSAELLQLILDYCEGPADTTVLVLTGLRWPKAVGGVDRGRRIEGMVKKLGGVFRFKAKDQDPVSFAMHFAEEAGCSLSRQDAIGLVEMVGGDLSRIRLEIDKLSLWLEKGETIDSEALSEVCSMLSEAEIWALTDAIVERNADKALVTTHRLLESGEPAHRIISMIAWQIRQLLQLQEAVRHGRDPRSSGVRMPTRKLRAATARLRERPISALGLLGSIAQANERMNSWRTGQDRILEGLVLALVAN